MIMADQEQSRTSRREMEPKERRDMAGKIGERHAGEENMPEASQSGVKPSGTVGRDVPDESKEHHTEIAVEAGRTGGQHRDNK
jgi:hypothetical protein